MSSYPAKFGKYLLLERVNVGGMAEVFKAKTFGVAGFERILAVKRILPNLVEDEEFIRMFIDEARIAVQLNHTNVVQIYELGKHGEHYYIAMEYIGSRDLRAILDRMRGNGQLMAIPQAAYITAKVCEGLDYAHRRTDGNGNPMNIIHRDVSPQNVLLGFEGEVKVIDFGIAKAANRASKTQAGVLKGKFGYMSPEQVRGLPTDRRSDIFAVGVLLYEMLTGERLFIGESDFSTLERVRNAEVTPPTRFNKKISPQLEEIVLRTLAREVEDRFQWASELADELQPFIKEDAKTVFNMKRLSAIMKDTYAAEIALEKQKMDEFRRVSVEDAKHERGSQNAQSSILPLHAPGHGPTDELQRPTPQRPAATLSEVDDFEPDEPEAPDQADEADGFGEDKTFVIEASTAGLALQASPGRADPRAVTSLGDASLSNDDHGINDDELPTRALNTRTPPPAARAAQPKPPSGSGKSSTAPKGVPRPGSATNDDFLQQVSLYGDDSADFDDSRTLVSVSNPLLQGAHGTDESDIDASELQDPDPIPQPPPREQQMDSASRDPATMRGSMREALSDAPTMAVASASAATRAAPSERVEVKKERSTASAPQRQSRPSQALDPVAAAMAEEDRLAIEILKGTTGGRSGGAQAAARPGNGADQAGAQLPVGYGGRDVTEMGAAVVTETAAEIPPEPAFDGSGGTPPDGTLMPSRVADNAISPQMMRVILGATAASTLIFLIVLVVAVMRLGGGGQSGQVVLFMAGEVQPTGSVRVLLDGAEVATSLPATFTAPAGAHVLRVEGKGVKAVERPLKMNGRTAKQPILFEADGAAPVADGDPAPTPTPTPSGDPGAGPKLAMRVPPPVASGWRLSLAAVADDTGKPITDAEVLIDNEPWGTAPFEAEIDQKKDKVEVRVRAPGFKQRAVDVTREGRDAVGPATIRLSPAPGETAAVVPADPPPDAVDDPAGAASTKPDKVAVKATDPQPAKQPDKQPDKQPAKQPDKQPEKQPIAKGDPGTAKPAAAADTKPKSKPAKLQIGTRPTMQVSVDGKVKGAKLFYGGDALEVGVGGHSVELFDAKTKKKHKLKVIVSADNPQNKLVFDGNATPPTFKTEGSVSAKLTP